MKKSTIEEVKDYQILYNLIWNKLDEMFRMYSEQNKIDINKYLDTLPEDQKEDIKKEIYEWKIQGRKDNK